MSRIYSTIIIIITIILIIIIKSVLFERIPRFVSHVNGCDLSTQNLDINRASVFSIFFSSDSRCPSNCSSPPRIFLGIINAAASPAPGEISDRDQLRCTPTAQPIWGFINSSKFGTRIKRGCVRAPPRALTAVLCRFSIISECFQR